MPKAPSTLDRVIRIVAEQLGKKPAEIRPDSTFASLGADDLDFIEIVMATEEELDVALDENRISAAAGVKDPAKVGANLTISKFAALADNTPKYKRPENNEPNDGGLKAGQFGTYGEISRLPNPRGHKIVFVPPLEGFIAAAEKSAGRKFTEAEVTEVKANASVIVMPPEDAAAFEKQRLKRDKK